jgi:carbohydrate-selective porin OprB
MRYLIDTEARRWLKPMAIAVALALAGGFAPPAVAQALPGSADEPAAGPTTPAATGAAGKEVAPASALYPDLLDSTLSVEGDLMDDESTESTRSGFFRRPTALDPWFAWKRMLRENYGFTFGGSWMMLWQNYSSSPIGQYNAVGSKLTLNFSYDLLNRNQPDALAFDMAVEDRRPIGTNLAPLQAGFGAGSATATAATYGQFDMGITQAYLRQNLFNNRFQWTIGKLFAPNYVDAYPFFDDNRQFLNQAFATSPSIAVPLRGFGAVAAVYPTNGGLYIKPGIFTSNSSDTGSTVGDFFSKNEHFYMVETGISSLARSGAAIQARGPMDADNIHLTSWYKDPQPGIGMPRAYGFAFNANYRYGENLMWFTRAGWSDGWLIDRAAAVGIGWRPTPHNDLFGVSLGWARPSNHMLDSQYVGEIFYRFQVTPNFAITPDFQAIVHPALNPGTNVLWVVSMRGRVVF